MPLRFYIVWLCVLGMMVLARADNDQPLYRFGPQDEISVTVLKHLELSQKYTVPPDGIIDFPRAGRINVIGKSGAEVADALKDKYAEFLVDPIVSVVLKKARVKNASIMGAVAKPGQYPITDTTRVTELIAAAGDLLGERKELTANITRGNTVIPINLQAALSGTDAGANPVLEDGDLLRIIAPAKITVTVLGQVKNPGAVKIREGSTPVDALAEAGDITEKPDRVRISLVRGAITEKLKWGDATVTLQDGDVIQVEREQLSRIYVNGQVKNPLAYDLPEGGGVMEAIALAGGPLPSASLGQITIVRAKDGTSERVDLSEAFSKGIVKTNPKLYPGDNVIVPEWTASISVYGMVAKAGSFPISESSPMTVVDAISMAGGADKRAKLADVAIIRVVDNKPQRIPVNVTDILKKGKYNENIVLKPRDIVYVPDNGRTDWNAVVDNLYKIGFLATL